MTQEPDRNTPEDPNEGSGGSGEVGRKLDEDAAWRSIIENYGDEPSIEDLYASPSVEPPPSTEPGSPGDPESPSVEPGSSSVEPVEPDPRFKAFERRWEPEPQHTEATWDNEGHFVPPEPPPMPKLEPRRKLAWIGLFGGPVLMLIAVVFGWRFPEWFSFLVVAGFLGGFGYLVATMPRTRGEDDSGDNGAVV
jgi:hypothetical protein